MATSGNKDAKDQRVISSRAYQIEMFEASLKRNVIVVV
jgi:hypothetical protein